MKSKKKSFLLILLVSFWIGYVLISVVHTSFMTIQAQEEINTDRQAKIEFLMKTVETFLLQENTDLVREHLNYAMSLKFIDYYCVKSDDKILFEAYPRTNASACAIIDNHAIEYFGSFYEFKKSKRILKPIQIENYKAIVGFDTDLWLFLFNEHRANLIPFLKDICFVTFFVFVLIYLVMKDFLMLDQLLQKGQSGNLRKIKARSKEAQTLIESAITLDQLNFDNSEKIHHLQNTVGLAIHSEIDRKTAHLTQIPCSVVRIDLNGYTQIFLDKKEEHIVSVLNEYFSVTSDLIKRYNGQIYQIIGDEIIFIFKNQDIRTPLFCVRAIFEWAQELDRKILGDYNHRFLLKASISHGHLKFVQLNNGYAFAGVPLIESVRLLGCVSDKSENTLIIKKEDSESLVPFLKNPTTKSVDLKGFDDKSEIFEIKDFVQLNDFFNSGLSLNDSLTQKSALASLSYFRGHQDILVSMQLLDKSLSAQRWNECFYLVQHLKEMKLGVPHLGIVNKLYQILSDHFQLITSQSKELPFLNSLVLLSGSLVNRLLWTVPWSNLLKNYLFCTHPRIVANATEVLCHFGFDTNEMQSILVNWKDNNRISGNFLLSEMKKSIEKANVKTILSWLDSSNVLFQASGLYIVEETLKHYQTEDPLIFKTNSLLTDCVQACEKLKDSDNELVKSRYLKLQSVTAKANEADSDLPKAV